MSMRPEPDMCSLTICCTAISSAASVWEESRPPASIFAIEGRTASKNATSSWMASATWDVGTRARNCSRRLVWAMQRFFSEFPSSSVANSPFSPSVVSPRSDSSGWSTTAETACRNTLLSLLPRTATQSISWSMSLIAQCSPARWPPSPVDPRSAVRLLAGPAQVLPPVALRDPEDPFGGVLVAVFEDRLLGLLGRHEVLGVLIVDEPAQLLVPDHERVGDVL